MIAELHNKISATASNLSEKLEDQLTGDFFGTLRYLPIEIGVCPILQRVKPKIENRIIEQIIKCKKCQYVFWPISSWGEIDLVIEFYCGNNAPFYVVGVEVKYDSGISSDQELEPSSSSEEVPVTHQLWRYMNFLSSRYPDIEKGLIYLTRKIDQSVPHVVKALSLDQGRSGVTGHSLSWNQTHQVIRQEIKRKPLFPNDLILSDLEAFLDHRDLSNFSPITIPTFPSVGYSFSARHSDFSFYLEKQIKIVYKFQNSQEKFKFVPNFLNPNFEFN